MATTKSSAKTSPGKRPATVAVSATAKAKAATKAAPPVKPEPVAKAKAVRKPVAKAAVAKPTRSRAKKPAGVPLEQRRNYIEMAAYYIAERRGFAPGNLLEDWVQAEAEIDRLLAEGLLGG
ncbi:MAG: DUF2934 domain-containing protein [Rhodocyclales bacterium]|nr:DUF2934 domain-containing protein [Rhodocyclales bacterium]